MKKEGGVCIGLLCDYPKADDSPAPINAAALPNFFPQVTIQFPCGDPLNFAQDPLREVCSQ